MAERAHQSAETREWWHAWGGVMAEGTDFEGCWATVVVGPSFVHPQDAGLTTPPGEVTRIGLDYLHSWDHEPSDEEKDALTPEEYQDDQPDSDGTQGASEEK